LQAYSEALLAAALDSSDLRVADTADAQLVEQDTAGLRDSASVAEVEEPMDLLAFRPACSYLESAAEAMAAGTAEQMSLES